MERSAADRGGNAVREAGAEAAERADPLPVPTGRRVVLLVVDTLRADRLGCYGYRDQPTTPTLDRLAEQGIAFDRFHAASPWTAPSFGSILTGVSPSVHRIGEKLPKHARAGAEAMGVRVTGLRAGLPSLPELIPGVPSAAIVTNAFLHPAFGWNRGFDHYDHQNAGLSRSRRADAVTAAAIAWLETRRDSGFFLLVHYFDPHITYDPPPEYAARFAPGPSGRMKRPFSDHQAARDGALHPTEEEKAFIRGLYNGEVRFVDDQVGKLVDAMGRLGMLEDSWIAVTADHGEEQFDHGSFDHGHRYEEEVTRVPLIVRPPGGAWRAGSRVAFSASHVDLAPTVLDWLSVRPPEHMEGRTLMPLLAGEERAHRIARMEYNLYWKQQAALYDGQYKLIRDTDGGNRYLYDLTADPLEQIRLGPSHPRLQALEQQLLHPGARPKPADAPPAPQGGVALPAEVEKSLRSLGYIE